MSERITGGRGRATEGFHHVTLAVRDARRAHAFYGGTLGLSLVGRTVAPGDDAAHLLYLGSADAEPGTLLALLERPGERRGAPGLGGVHHFALGVESRDALLKWKRRLTDRGVRVSGPFDRHWFHSLYFTDPDGQIVEIATHGPGYAVDEPANALGGRVVVPGEGHLRGQRDEAAIRAETHPEPVPEVTPGMALTGIHHVSAMSDDIPGAHDFYTAALGLRLVKRSVNQDDPSMPHWFWARYDGERVAPHSSITLFGFPPHARRARPGVGQTHAVTFRADGDEELLAWREHLRERNVHVSEVEDRGWFRSIAFRASDGLPLEIATDGRGFARDGETVGPGVRLHLPAHREPERARIEARLTPLT